MSIDNMTPSELRQLADKLEVVHRGRDATKPKPLENIDYTIIEGMAKQAVDDTCQGRDRTDSQFFYDEVMVAVFGADYFEWENAQP